MTDPLDLDALSKLARCTCDPLRANTHEPRCPLIVIPRCLAAIEALREAIEPLLTTAQVDGSTTAAWNRAYCDARAALALVTGGKAAVSHHEDRVVTEGLWATNRELQRRLEDAGALHLADEQTIRNQERAIEALRDALKSVPDHPHAGMCQFRPPYFQLGPRPCTCYIGKIQVALALVTGGRDA